MRGAAWRSWSLWRPAVRLPWVLGGRLDNEHALVNSLAKGSKRLLATHLRTPFAYPDRCTVNAGIKLTHYRRDGVDPSRYLGQPVVLSPAVVVVCPLRRRTQQVMRAEEACLAFLPEPVALSPNVEDVAVVQQPVQDG